MYSVIIPAAGSGSRANLGYNKMLHQFNDEYLFNLTLKVFLKDPEFTEIFLVINEKDEAIIKKKLVVDSRIKLVFGGATRQKSVQNAVLKVTNEIVFIHDGARPFVTSVELKKLKEMIQNERVNCALAEPVINTIHQVENGFVKCTLKRDELFSFQTPQVCFVADLKQCYLKAEEKQTEYTDEVGMLVANQIPVKVVLGEPTNIKVTYQTDFKENK